MKAGGTKKRNTPTMNSLPKTSKSLKICGDAQCGSLNRGSQPAVKATGYILHILAVEAVDPEHHHLFVLSLIPCRGSCAPVFVAARGTVVMNKMVLIGALGWLLFASFLARNLVVLSGPAMLKALGW